MCLWVAPGGGVDDPCALGSSGHKSPDSVDSALLSAVWDDSVISMNNILA